MPDPQKITLILPYAGPSTLSFLTRLPAGADYNILLLNGPPAPAHTNTRSIQNPQSFWSEKQENPPTFVVFLDEKCDPAQLPRILGPVERNEAPIVIGSRRLRKTSPLPLATRLYNSIACQFIRLTTGKVYTDISPFRALTFNALQKTSPHPTKMQFLAPRNQLKVLEIPIDYHP
ncbi:MAG TPA: hypothetical protein VFE58_11725 [Tepidisphaeraceae bacterium]|jgi:hypothetical protein|nr:hypothetical protein [Tepidisphaeraceae bacterium]